MDVGGNPLTINERIIFLRKKTKKRISSIAKQFNVYKDVAYQWEKESFWEDLHSSLKKLRLLVQLADFYGCEYKWLLSGEPGQIVRVIIINHDKKRKTAIKRLIRQILKDKTIVYVFPTAVEALFYVESFKADIVMSNLHFEKKMTTDPVEA